MIQLIFTIYIFANNVFLYHLSFALCVFNDIYIYNFILYNIIIIILPINIRNCNKHVFWLIILFNQFDIIFNYFNFLLLFDQRFIINYFTKFFII